MMQNSRNVSFKKNHGERRVLTLLGADPSAFLCDGAFHQQHNEHKRDHDNGQHPEHIEVGERRCLLLAQQLALQTLANLREQQASALAYFDEGTRSRIEGIEPFAKAEAVELVTALLHRLS